MVQHDPDRGRHTKSALTARVVSGSIGSVLTSLLVTPLEVVKVRTQNEPPKKMATAVAGSPNKPSVVPCPRGCGTFVLFNGQLDCIVPKTCVPYFDHTTGKLLASQQQQQQQAGVYKALSSSRARASVGTFAMIRRIFAQEGLSGIYAGLRPTLVMGE